MNVAKHMNRRLNASDRFQQVVITDVLAIRGV
jgi:hypothetical protein